MVGAGLTTLRKLSSGFDMPVFGLGVYRVQPGQSAYDTVKEALRLGYRHLDTAAFYGNEADVGRAMRESGVKREDMFVTTKLRPGAGGGGYAATQAEFQRSFDLLNVGYIDSTLV